MVMAVAVFDPPKDALAPVAGAVKVTVTPLSRLFPASLTVTWSAEANGVLTVALCGVPAVAIMLAGGPGRLVMLKLAGVPTPAAVAVTV